MERRTDIFSHKTHIFIFNSRASRKYVFNFLIAYKADFNCYFFPRYTEVAIFRKMLSSQQQPQFNHHHQFHQSQQQQLPPMPGAAAFCGSTSEIKLEPPTHIFIGANSGFVQQQQTVPPSTGPIAASMNQQMNVNGVFQQQSAMKFHQNGGSHNGVHSQQQQMINQHQQNNLGASNGLGKIETPAAANNNTSQPGAWFFSPPLLNCQLPPNQQDQELGSPGSPGLMAPHQLLARFGPRHCTESVEVPSSEHVAEIVGRQGCKIKALRAKTNTYIKTPVRGEEPFFVVTGRQEDVAEARREIECAAEHFTQIRASRRHSQGGCPAPGHVTAYVRVPLRVVGLVVGPKGNTIKRIQQDTHTYIITPSREREPIFEVTGLPQNVEAARREIENHIYQRTGNMPITDPNASIASYDLHAAALQAQQSMQTHSGGHRPNYGALAVNSAAARNWMQMSGGRTTSPISYQQSHLRLNFPQNVCNKMTNFGGSERGDSSPNQQHAFGASTNNLHMLLGGLELDASNGIGENGQQRTHQPTVGHQLLRSFSTQNGRSGDLPAGNGFYSATTTKSAFSPWNGTNGVNHNGDPERVVDFLDLISSSPSPLFASSNGCQSSFSVGSIAGFVGHPQGVVSGGIGSTGMSSHGHGGLSSVNSSSRDEGLGDSPTNSFGRPQGTDYQYQHLMTIWNDLVDQPASNGGSAELQKESEETKSAATTPAKETTSTTASATVGQQS